MSIGFAESGELSRPDRQALFLRDAGFFDAGFPGVGFVAAGFVVTALAGVDLGGDCAAGSFAGTGNMGLTADNDVPGIGRLIAGGVCPLP